MIKQRQDARILGIEIDEDYAAVARDRLDRVVVADAEAFLRDIQPETPFDCVIAADVLEHLVDPWTVVERSAAMLAPRGTFVVSLPNVFYWKALWRAVRHARWPRDDQGIFDRTHLRWFGQDDARELLSAAGLEVIAVVPCFWETGWRQLLTEQLYPTPVGPYLPAQHIIVALQPPQ